MELEFDKEIDAILRRARDNRGVLVGDDPPEKHIDADVIAAFAENALPEKAKLLYIEHFAGCDRCRKLLSQTISMNSEADVTTASVVSAPVAEMSIPWYQGLFKSQNLALTMGALVLVFSGVLGYFVLQNGNNTADSSLSKVAEPQSPQGGPYYSGESANAAANSANATSTASNSTASNTTAPAFDAPTAPAANAPGTLAGRRDSPGGAGFATNTCQECGITLDDEGRSMPKPVTAVPPSPADQPTAGREEKKLDKEKQKDEDVTLAARSRATDDRVSRDVPAAPSKTGPSRSGPLQTKSNEVNSNIYDMSVKRVVGGKTFENRDRVWYDSAYRGQATTNVRRGTDAYKKLDSGLRNIANTLDGTVVVVWKEKAYRIQ